MVEQKAEQETKAAALDYAERNQAIVVVERHLGGGNDVCEKCGMYTKRRESTISTKDAMKYVRVQDALDFADLEARTATRQEQAMQGRTKHVTEEELRGELKEFVMTAPVYDRIKKALRDKAVRIRSVNAHFCFTLGKKFDVNYLRDKDFTGEAETKTLSLDRQERNLIFGIVARYLAGPEKCDNCGNTPFHSGASIKLQDCGKYVVLRDQLDFSGLLEENEQHRLARRPDTYMLEEDARGDERAFTICIGVYNLMREALKGGEESNLNSANARVVASLAKKLRVQLDDDEPEEEEEEQEEEKDEAPAESAKEG